MIRGNAQAAFLLLAVSSLFFCTACGSEGAAVPLCGEVRGFASEFNHRIRIGVSTTLSKDEAVVLVVRAFPITIGDLAQRWVQLNATYRLREGATVSSQSNNNGIIVINNVEVGTDIEVHIKRVRQTGPVPFRLWSYYANRPLCYIGVSPDNSFLGPIPSAIGGEIAIPAKMYFKFVMPKGASGLMVKLIDFEHSRPLSFHAMSTPQDSLGVVHQSGEVFPWTDGVMYLMFVPEISTAGYVFIEVSVVWTDDTGSPGEGSKQKPIITTTPSPDSLGPGTSVTSSTADSISVDNKGWTAVQCLFMLLFCLIIYIVVLSVVNYRLKGITQFPEMIPHIEIFRSCFGYVSLLKECASERKFHRGYHDLNREEITTDGYV